MLSSIAVTCWYLWWLNFGNYGSWKFHKYPEAIFLISSFFHTHTSTNNNETTNNTSHKFFEAKQDHLLQTCQMHPLWADYNFCSFIQSNLRAWNLCFFCISYVNIAVCFISHHVKHVWKQNTFWKICIWETH